MKELLGKYFKGDAVIWAVIVGLSIFSLLAVYSSTGTLAYKYQGGNTTYYFIKHLGFLLFGVLIIFVTHLIPYKYYSRLSQLLLFLSIPLLAVTLILGTSLNEASRWLTLPGIGLTFQTSDFAKLSLLMYTARLLAIKQDNIKEFKGAFRPIMIPVMIVCGLIFPANFSTAAILFATTWILMFVGRVNLKYLFGLIGVGILFIVLFIVIANFSTDKGRIGTWKKRIENFSNGESENNYQSDQAKIAIVTGGVFGKLPGNSTQRNFLPHPYSDFIYAIIIEEYGAVGGFVVLLLYLILLYRAGVIVKRSSWTFPAFLAIGLGFSLVFQAFINMAVAVNLFPVTGQPLPLVSMGGTSLLFTCVALGIMLSLSRSIQKPEPNVQPA